MARRRSPIGPIVLILATAAVAVAVILARSPGTFEAPRQAAARATPTISQATPAPARAEPTVSPVTATPTRAAPTSGQITKAEVIARARDDSLKNLGMEMLEARVDEVTADLMSADDAGKRLEAGWLPTSNQVWWVHVRGHFRYVGTTSFAETPFATFEASERFLAYDARTGELLSQSIPGDPASSMPIDKRAAGATEFARQAAIGKGLLPPDTPVPEPTSCPEDPDQGPSPMRTFSLGLTPPAGLRPTNYAIVRSTSGKLYTLYAGSKADDPQQGLVLVSEQVPDPCAEARGLAPKLQAISLTTPFRSGPVRVFRIEAGNQVTLETPERLRVKLDFVAQQFGAAEQAQIPPIPTPYGKGATKAEPRSAPATVGVAYPFSLQTHCGVDQYVDFDGSFWDLDDPAFIRADGTDYFYAVGFNTTEGTMTLVDADHAVFTYERAQIHFKRHQGTKYIMLCA